ncbi:barwin-like endoglucanase [Obba rivulosa]|uniref:Barwin-like endoglucanase n=1 Tax=Obba rivulosa TaxID=1052685 RepID=A0A8E2J2Q6_9APHY|nr:barwin-like endoglucanase [Obba rivulosa]
MMQILSILSVAFAATSAVSGLVIPVARDDTPSSYDSAALEPYDQYHARYMALGCENQHDSDFFNTCCHPLLAGESLSSRPAECTPASSSSSAAPVPTTAAPALTTAVPALTSSASALTSAVPVANVKAAASASVNAQVFTDGVATFFYQNGVAGACGTVHSDWDVIAAIDQDRYGDSGVESSLCGQQVLITNPANGKSVTVTIADDCPTCKNSDSIDLSLGAFTQIATEEQGEVSISWHFL